MGERIDKNLLAKLDECPLLYKQCPGKDSTCLSDLKKFLGCDIFPKQYRKHLKSLQIGYEPIQTGFV